MKTKIFYDKEGAGVQKSRILSDVIYKYPTFRGEMGFWDIIVTY